MYPYILGMSLLKTSVPYFRKHILNTLSSLELVFLNTFFIFILVVSIFLYSIFVSKTIHADKMIENYRKLELTQIIALIVIAFLTVSSSFIINEFDKNYNTPLMNTLFVRGISLIFVIGIGIFLFEEKYNWKQILGIFFTISGLILLFQKDKK